MDSTLLSFILPEGLSDYFDFDKAEIVGGSTYIYLIEKNIHPQEFLGEQLLSKGFFDEVSVRDFPLRGKRAYLEASPISCKPLGSFFGVDGKRLEEQYASHLSGFTSWDQAEHGENWLLFADNIGEYLSIDETSLSQGELYTVLTNKGAKGKKGTLVAVIKGTESESVITVLHRINERVRIKVKEVTLDVAPTMVRIVKKEFSKGKACFRQVPCTATGQ